MFSEAPASWKSFVRQKTRHLGAGTYYRWKDKWLLGAILFFEVFSISLLIIFAFLNLLEYWMIVIYMIKFALKGRMYLRAQKKLASGSWYEFALFDLLNIFLSSGLYMKSHFQKKKIDWN